MTTLTRAEILAHAAAAPAMERVDAPLLGGVVYVRGMTAKERDAYEASVIQARRQKVTLGNVRARLLVSCVADETGHLLFTLDDLELLGGLPAAAVDDICDVAQRLSGFQKADMDALSKDK